MVSEKKVVLIRGVNPTLYKSFVAKAKEQGRTVGDLINETMRMSVHGRGGGENPSPNTLEFGGSIVLSKEDILGIYEEMGRFSIKNSGSLALDKNVDKEALQCIAVVQNTGNLRVPKHIHPLVLIKARKVYGTIEKY